MGLNNEYVGETRDTGNTALLVYSRNWIHRFANRQGLAYTDDEALELGIALNVVASKSPLPDARIIELLGDQELDLSGALGRLLEDDECEFLSKNPDFAVVDA